MCLVDQRKNLAAKGTATQSSTKGHNIAVRAIDGNGDGNFAHGSCTETIRQNNPWWKVTFNYDILVKIVTIENRADCCGKLVNNIICPGSVPSVISLRITCVSNSG